MPSNDRTEQFAVNPGLKLGIQNLSAIVRVQVGASGTAEVRVTGDEDYRKAVTVHYSPDENRLSVTEALGQRGGGGVVIAGDGIVIGGDGVQVNSFGRGGSYSSVISTGCGVSISARRIIVDGVDITQAVNEASGKTGPTIPRSIVIRVPVGTDVGIDDCDDVGTSGTGGRLRASLSSNGSLRATGVTGVKVKMSGQADVAIHDSAGSLDLAVRGQSGVSLTGKFEDVNLSVSGQSSVVGSGTFGHVDGDVSGQSTVNLVRAASQTVRSSGQSSVRIDAPRSQSPRRPGDWDF